MIKQLSKRGIDLITPIRQIEQRFLDDADKDFLLMVISSMIKGKKVEVKKVNQPVAAKKETESVSLLSSKDKENVMSIFEMMGGEHSKQKVEKIYL